jgi:hypothetical protein
MQDKNQVDITSLINNNELVLAALQKGTRDAMKRHIAFEVPMVSWKDGKVVEIPVEKLLEMVRRDEPDYLRFLQ